MSKQNKIEIKSPTRIDLAGGTLDCWPINAMFSPVTTINIAISLYTEAQLIPREDTRIHIVSQDTGLQQEFSSLDHLLEAEDEALVFFQEHIHFWSPQQGFELTTRSESPIGGGLGGSSSLSCSIFKAFNTWLGEDIDIVDAVQICSGIEAKILGVPTGTQDYFPAFDHGLQIIDYVAGQPLPTRLEPHAIANLQNIALFYTGRAHHSGLNNWQIIKSFVDGDEKTIRALADIQEVAFDMRELLLTKDFAPIGELFAREYSARLQLAETFSSPEIEKIDQVAKARGGLATKICGAGGGGCVFVWTEENRRQDVIDACVSAGFQHLDVGFV